MGENFATLLRQLKQHWTTCKPCIHTPSFYHITSMPPPLTRRFGPKGSTLVRRKWGPASLQFRNAPTIRIAKLLALANWRVVFAGWSSAFSDRLNSLQSHSAMASDWVAALGQQTTGGGTQNTAVGRGGESTATDDVSDGEVFEYPTPRNV